MVKGDIWSASHEMAVASHEMAVASHEVSYDTKKRLSAQQITLNIIDEYYSICHLYGLTDAFVVFLFKRVINILHIMI